MADRPIGSYSVPEHLKEDAKGFQGTLDTPVGMLLDLIATTVADETKSPFLGMLAGIATGTPVARNTVKLAGAGAKEVGQRALYYGTNPSMQDIFKHAKENKVSDWINAIRGKKVIDPTQSVAANLGTVNDAVVRDAAYAKMLGRDISNHDAIKMGFIKKNQDGTYQISTKPHTLDRKIKDYTYPDDPEFEKMYNKAKASYTEHYNKLKKEIKDLNISNEQIADIDAEFEMNSSLMNNGEWDLLDKKMEKIFGKETIAKYKKYVDLNYELSNNSPHYKAYDEVIPEYRKNNPIDIKEAGQNDIIMGGYGRHIYNIEDGSINLDYYDVWDLIPNGDDKSKTYSGALMDLIKNGNKQDGKYGFYNSPLGVIMRKAFTDFLVDEPMTFKGTWNYKY
jgi:hypothetical protein